ncbi:DnaB-like helicase C-terminal domain-containing protein [Sphingomonas sp. MMS24-JH45]
MATLAFPQPAPAAPVQLPADVEAEAAMLGAMPIDNRLADDIVDRLEPQHFFEPVHGRVFAAIKTLRGKDMLASPVTLRPMFEADEGMRELGVAGLSRAAHRIGRGPDRCAAVRAAGLRSRDAARSGHGGPHARRSCDGRRRGGEPARADRGGGGGAFQGFRRRPVGEHRQDLRPGEHHGGADGGKGAELGRQSSASPRASNWVDAKIGGLHHSDLMILAGRPGMGKTSLATNIAFNAAQRWMHDMRDGIPPAKSVGAKVAFFSLEMSADQLATRILAEQSPIVRGAAHGHQQDRVRAARRRRRRAREFAALHRRHRRPQHRRAPHRVRRLQRRHNNEIGLVVVDYLQLLSGSGKAGDGNRVQEISEISRGLKTLAKDMNVPVLALSQLSRAVEQREDKRPQLSDLRESGSIEQDADMVWFVFREDYYIAAKEPKRPSEGDNTKIFEDHAAWAADMERIYGLAELIVAKQRHGATGKVTLKFDPTITRLSDYAVLIATFIHDGLERSREAGLDDARHERNY